MRLRSRVAKAGSCSSDSTSSLGTSIYHRCGSEKNKNKQTTTDCSAQVAIGASVQPQAWSSGLKDPVLSHLGTGCSCGWDSIPGLGNLHMPQVQA